MRDTPRESRVEASEVERSEIDETVIVVVRGGNSEPFFNWLASFAVSLLPVDAKKPHDSLIIPN